MSWEEAGGDGAKVTTAEHLSTCTWIRLDVIGAYGEMHGQAMCHHHHVCIMMCVLYASRERCAIHLTQRQQPPPLMPLCIIAAELS
jgi:hypothetical protein